jgi:hypothetical protein
MSDPYASTERPSSPLEGEFGMSLEADRDTIYAADETQDLISSEKVEGTAVFSREREKLGSIHHFMVGKRDGQVRYAVLSFGGLFEGDRYYPLPWNALSYNTGLGGYEIGIDKEQLKNSPSFERGSEPTYDAEYDRQLRATATEVRQSYEGRPRPPLLYP